MTKLEKKSTQQTPLFKHDIISFHIATSTTKQTKGFPPPICHRLIGYGAIVVSRRRGEIILRSQVDLNNETVILNKLMEDLTTHNRDVVNFIPHNFTLPVIRGAAYREGFSFDDNREGVVLNEEEEDRWFDVGGWFGGGGRGNSNNTSMGDCAVAMGLAPRHPIDIAVALRDKRFSDIKDQLLVDAFMTLCMWLRQRVVNGFGNEERCSKDTYLTVVRAARKKVRSAVSESGCKKYVSWKGMLDKGRFLME